MRSTDPDTVATFRGEHGELVLYFPEDKLTVSVVLPHAEIDIVLHRPQVDELHRRLTRWLADHPSV